MGNTNDYFETLTTIRLNNENSDEAKQIADLVDRIKENEFPIVPATMQKHMPDNDAQDLLAWIQKEEYIKIRSEGGFPYTQHDAMIKELYGDLAWHDFNQVFRNHGDIVS